MIGGGAERPILVVGCPRSGTTLLQVMLHAHSRIAIPPETKYLVEAYRARAGFGDLSTVAGRVALADFVVGRPTFCDLGLDPDAVRNRILAAPPTVGSGLAAVHEAYAERFGKPRWGDKRPGQFQDLRVLL